MKRRQINDKIVAFLLCITALEEVVPKNVPTYRERDVSAEENEDKKEKATIGNTLYGIAFWIVFD